MAGQATFISGWDPVRAQQAHIELIASQRYARVARGQTSPDYYSLDPYVLRPMMQQQQGTCWEHAGVCLAETTANALGYQAFPICRRLVGFEGKKLEGGGNQSDGGAVSDALAAMTRDRGVGIAHEDLCPYVNDRDILGQKPPQVVYDDARKSDLKLPVVVNSDEEAMILISSGRAVSIGTWWPYNYDDNFTIMSAIGNGTYGHALTKFGYVKPGVVKKKYWEKGAFRWMNWHGALYPPIPDDIAAQIGAKVIFQEASGLVHDFWVPLDQDAQLQNMGNYEYVSATDLNGLNQNVVITNYDGILV